jgi:hypothetical protein
MAEVKITHDGNHVPVNAEPAQESGPLQAYLDLYPAWHLTKTGDRTSVEQSNTLNGVYRTGYTTETNLKLSRIT